MNVLEHTIVKIVEEPHQVINDEDCCWEVKTIVTCCGYDDPATFRTTTKTSISQYKIGYTYKA